MNSILRSELFISLEQVTPYLRRAQTALAALGRSVADELQRLRGALRARENHLPELLHRGRNTLMTLGKSVVDERQRLKEVFRARENHLRRLFRRARTKVTTLGRNVARKHRRLQEALRARENGLRMLLTSSLDAIVVINGDHRFIGANAQGLDLFGISEANMGKFGIDAFLSDGQMPKFNGNGSPFTRRTEKHGKCEIRRLDGSLRVAEYIFVGNFAPFRHLCRFRTVTAIDQYRPATLRTLGIQSRIRAQRAKAGQVAGDRI